MASLEKKGRRFLVVFRLNGSRYKKRSVQTDEREAEAIAAKVERRIGMLERGEWQLPDPTQVAESLIGDLAMRRRTADGKDSQRPHRGIHRIRVQWLDGVQYPADSQDPFEPRSEDFGAELSC